MAVVEVLSPRSTIYALSSGRPPAAIAIVRISGPAALETLSTLTRKPLPASRVMTLAAVYHPESGAMLDRALVVGFAAAASVTGEQVAELHLHGSSAVVAAVLDALGSLPSLRLADPGEFTRQAFDNGKLDLTEVEGLANLIAATTEAQRVHALDAARGGLRAAVEYWRSILLDALVIVESELDFADEQADVITTRAMAEHEAQLKLMTDQVDTMLEQSGRGERLRDGLTIAIVGEPNVGKSSLLNSLSKRDVAITSPFPGTTRDVIELPFELAGFPMTLIDTAGLRDDASDPAEQEGIIRARQQAAKADLVLHVCTTAPAHPLGQVVINKIDLSDEPAGLHGNMLHVSAATSQGLSELCRWLEDWAKSATTCSEPIVIGSRRQAAVLRELSSKLPHISQVGDLAMRAEALRNALVALSRMFGRYDTEEVLDNIFSRFCIGK